MLQRGVTGFLLLVSVFLLIGCVQVAVPPAEVAQPSGSESEASQPSEAAESSEAPQPQEVEEYVVLAVNWQHPYWIDIRTGGEYFQEAMGDAVNVTFAGPEAFDIPGQVDAIQQQIPKNPAGMIIACFDPALIPAINQAVEAGIPVGTFESDCPEGNHRWFFVGVDAYQAGWAMGPELIKYMGESGQVIISTNVGASNSEEKIRGFKDFLASYPDIEVAATVDDKALVREGADALKPALLANPDTTAIIGINAGSGGAAATAVKELGLEDQVTIIAQDRDDITLQFIQEGVIDSTIVARTATNTYMGLLLLYQYNHYDVPITADNQANNVNWLPSNVDVGTIVVNQSNADAFFH